MLLIELASYIVVAYMFLEYGAAYKDGAYVWPYPKWFIILFFVAWPVLVPWSIRRLRKMQRRGGK